MIISEDIYAMLMTHEKFKTFTPKALCDTTKSAEVLITLSCGSRAHVDDLVSKAPAAGGTTYDEPEDYGFMYQHSYQELEGHGWGLIYMDPNHGQ